MEKKNLYIVLSSIFLLVIQFLIGGCGGKGAGSGSDTQQLNTGATTSYSYDANGRLKSIQYSNGKTIYFQYDAAGNITSRAVK